MKEDEGISESKSRKMKEEQGEGCKMKEGAILTALQLVKNKFTTLPSIISNLINLETLMV